MARAGPAGAAEDRRGDDVRRTATGSTSPGRPRVIHAPGHTDGCVALHFEGHQALLVGDVLCSRNPLTGRKGIQVAPAAFAVDAAQALASIDRRRGRRGVGDGLRPRRSVARRGRRGAHRSANHREDVVEPGSLRCMVEGPAVTLGRRSRSSGPASTCSRRWWSCWGQVEADGSSDTFYTSCARRSAACGDGRALVFRYDAARRRVRAAGRSGSRSSASAARTSVESAPIARQALVEDRVIDVDAGAAGATARGLPRPAGRPHLVCAPLSAGGRWRA